jgi:hypothetical protein
VWLSKNMQRVWLAARELLGHVHGAQWDILPLCLDHPFKEDTLEGATSASSTLIKHHSPTEQEGGGL